jgi:hypothetical protein
MGRKRLDKTIDQAMGDLRAASKTRRRAKPGSEAYDRAASEEERLNADLLELVQERNSARGRGANHAVAQGAPLGVRGRRTRLAGLRSAPLALFSRLTWIRDVVGRRLPLRS